MSGNESIFDAITRDPDAFSVYYGEILLKDWADNAAGESVEFWLNGTDAHPFKNFTSSKRTAGGSRFLAFIVEIDDDETPINQKQKHALKQAISEKIRNGKHSQGAALMCRTIDFHVYLIQRIARLDPDQKRIFAANLPHGLYSEMVSTKMKVITDDPDKGEMFAKLFLYWWCGMKSRRELDYSPKKFNFYNQIIQDFYKWNSSNVQGS